MKLLGGRARQRTGSSTQPPGRMSKRQELALFVCLLGVLLAVVFWGLHA